MQIASAYSVCSDPADAAAEVVENLATALGAEPQLIVVYATEHHAQAPLISALRGAARGAALIGGTSCGGVMTERGFHSGPAGAVGVLGVSDPDGSYGVGAAPLGDDAAQAGADAIGRALAAAGREFETPVLVWCCQPPGREEAVIDGIQSVIGSTTPIMGGSSADETIAGRWRQFADQDVLEDHVVVAALFPSATYGAAFQSGYAPTEHVGVVTRAAGRDILEIDGEPAAQVYERWTGGAVAADESGMILAKSTPTPLGRLAGEVNAVPMFVLSHPSLVGTGGDLSLFTDIAEGDEVRLMRGSPDSLVDRAGLVVRDACAMGGWRDGTPLGGLVIYCGGCMLHVRDRMDEVVSQVVSEMGGKPFLGAFTFGEQGAIIDRCNRHGNLMVSALALGR